MLVEVVLLVVLIGVVLGYVLLRLRGPTSGLFLTDVLALNVCGYALGAHLICATRGSVCAVDVVFLAHVVAIATVLASCILVAATGQTSKWNVRRWADLRHVSNRSEIELALHIALFVLCAMTSAVFIYSVFSQSGLGVDSGRLLTGETSLLDVRKMIASGAQGYMAPGYLKQIRDVLFPVLCAAFLLFGVPRRFFPFFIVCVLIGVSAMVLSGQRGPLVLLFAASTVALYIRRARTAEVSGAWLIILPLAGLGVFITVTVMLGRSGDGGSVMASVLSLPLAVLERVFARVPAENMVTINLWWSAAPTLGVSWLRDLSAILPGTQEMLSSELHQGIGGSAAGNSVLGVPADLYLAWGWIGAVLLPAVYALGAMVADRYLLLDGSAFAVSLKIFVTFAALQWYSPYLFILNGGVFLLPLLVVRLIRGTVSGRI